MLLKGFHTPPPINAFLKALYVWNVGFHGGMEETFMFLRGICKSPWTSFTLYIESLF